MNLEINSLYKHKTAKTICKIINIEDDTLDCVYPPDSYIFIIGRSCLRYILRSYKYGSRRHPQKKNRSGI